jgi:hypothetical protein
LVDAVVQGISMSLRQWGVLRVPTIGGLSLTLSALCTEQASAHVKWFCAYNVAGQPRGLENVLCPNFEVLMLTAFTMLLFGYVVEWSAIGTALLAALNRVTSGLRDDTDLIVRASCGFFFVACWANGGVILTPELKTASPIIPWIQLGLAACLIWRETLVVTAVGIAGLFAYAVYQYGIFHLLDYPIFLGIAAYLALIGLKRDLFGMRPIDVVRFSAAITLMWASIEKWAYPEWTFPLFITHPGMAMGFTREFYMQAAGMVEFTLSFALILTPLVRRVGAIILASMFVAAVPEFGKIDAIGHAPIIAVLLGIIGDDAPSKRLVHLRLGIKENLARFKVAVSGWDFLLIPAAYCAALAWFLAAYYVLHSVLYGTHIA